jgi:hypothetical protein
VRVPADRSIRDDSLITSPSDINEKIRLMFIRVTAKGPNVVPAFTTLSNDAVARGLKVFVEDPAQLATVGGNFEIELPNVDDDADGRAAVRALIDQIPNGHQTFAIIDRD